MRTLILAAVCVAALPAAAQRVHDTPARPRLFASADTNSANAYYLNGMRALREEPRVAAASFYWAARLRPGWADALYGRRVALLMSDPSRLVRYMEGDRPTLRSAEVQAIDSLYLRALMADPFMTPKLDRQLLEAWLTAAMSQRTGNRTTAAFDAQAMLNGASPFVKAWFAYGQGRFGEALGEYEAALRRSSRENRTRMRTDVARIQYFMGSYQPSLENFAAAVREFRERDGRDLVFVYESKALLEHSMGMVHEKMENADSARAAYGRALQEDLSYAPAHRRMAVLALAANDTATALAERALVVELEPGFAPARYDLGILLLLTGQVDAAVAEFRQAVRLEPFYADPYLVLGLLAARSGDNAEAERQLSEFLARSQADDNRRAAAQQALTQARAAQ